VSARPALALVELSDSFRSAWSELAEELRLDLVPLAPGDAPAPGTVAVLVAAGGEEDRALDALPTIPHTNGPPVYVVGANPSHRFAIEAVRRGATDYFALPGDLDLLRRSITARAETARERERPSGPVTPPCDPFESLRGQSATLQATLDDARRVLPHDNVTVLIRGETGTGKELLARALHDGGPRSGRSFVAVNCAAIPAELMESELFGQFLDEIGHLPLSLQGKLLRALEDHRMRRVGGTQSREMDVRIITASHVDLAAAVEDGQFREDLFHRLNVVSLTLPPLRERAEDIDVLAEHFATTLATRYALPVPVLSNEVREMLRGHTWPGNVRELRHAIERGLLLSESGTLDPQHLISRARPTREGGAIPFPATLYEIQIAAVRAALAQHGDNKSAAARQLGISRSRLQRLLERGEDEA
jgi:DNA-binding NtrC family response regulator